MVIYLAHILREQHKRRNVRQPDSVIKGEWLKKVK